MEELMQPVELAYWCSSIREMDEHQEDMISHENDSLRDRVADLDKKVQEQQDEILCLRSALADVLRRVSNLEMQKASAVSDNSPRRGGGMSRPSSVPAGARRSSESSPTSVYAVHRTNSPRHVQSTKPQTSSIKKWASSSEVPSGPASPAKRNGSITNLYDSGRMSPAPYPKGRNSSSGSLQSLSNLSDTGRTKSPTHSPSYNRNSAPLFRPFAASQFKGVGLAALGNDPALQASNDMLLRRTQKFPAREPVYHDGDGYLRMFLRGRALNLYSPSDLGEYDVTKALLPPNEKLKLEWVYGYRGRDCRNNLFLLPTGEMVYFVAAVVVLYNVDEQMQRHYLGHTDDVKCIAMHPNKLYIASGQVAGIDRREKKEENGIDQVQMSYMPHIRIWDSVSLHTLHVIGIGEFDRAVCCVGFSKADGGQYLCAVDEANEHILSVWDWHKGERGCKVAESKSAGDPVLACEFHPLDKNIIVTCGKNHINFWSLEANALIKKVGIFEKYDKPKYVLCIAFDDNGNCLSGDSNGSIIVWGRGSNKIVKVLLGAHDGGIFSLCVCKDGSIVSGGGKDRILAVWDSNFYQKVKSYELSETLGPVRTIAQGKGNMLIVGTTKNHIIQGTVDLKFSVIVQGHVDELWGLAVHPNHHQFVSCGYDRQIFFWDTLTHTTIWSKEIQDGAHAAGFHPNGNMVAIATLSARWLVLDLLTREVITTCTDGNESLSCISYSPDGRFIAIGSRDNHIYIYQVSEEGRKYNRVGRCTGHSSFVLHIDWSTDSQFLQSNSGDYEILLWSAAVCRQVTQPSSMRDIEWVTQTCTLGFNVCGIWPEGSDGTDVNSCARAHGKDLLATGDDYGKVKLFTYPCNKPKSAFHYYGGHSSHVTNVQFLYNDMRLISMGGKDMSIMQWQVV